MSTALPWNPFQYFIGSFQVTWVVLQICIYKLVIVMSEYIFPYKESGVVVR